MLFPCNSLFIKIRNKCYMNYKDRIHKIVNLGYYLFLKDFRYRYRQTFLGYFWAVLRPLLIGAPIIFIGKQFDLGSSSSSVPYEVYSFTGIILFQIFWDVVLFPQWVMRRSRQFFKNVRIPFEAVLVAGLCYALFNTSIYILMLVAICLLLGVKVSILVLLSIASVPLILLCGLAIGIYFAPITLVYLDIRYALPVLSTIFMWSTPLVYKSPSSGGLHYINKYNPLTYLLTIPREWMFGQSDTSVILFVTSILIFFIVLFFGFKFYYRAMPIGIDQIL